MLYRDTLKLLGSNALGIAKGLVAANVLGIGGGLGGRYLIDQAEGLTRRARGLYLDRGSEDCFKQIGALDSL